MVEDGQGGREQVARGERREKERGRRGGGNKYEVETKRNKEGRVGEGDRSWVGGEESTGWLLAGVVR